MSSTFLFQCGVRIVIMRLQGFRLVHIVGLDPIQTWVGNLAIHVMNSDFYSKVQVWLKASDVVRSWTIIARQHATVDTSSLSSLFSPSVIELHERSGTILKVGDFWVPIAAISWHHRIRFLFLGIEELFVVGDKVVQVEHHNFKVLIWRLGKDSKGLCVWNFAHENKMHMVLILHCVKWWSKPKYKTILEEGGNRLT